MHKRKCEPNLVEWFSGEPMIVAHSPAAPNRSGWSAKWTQDIPNVLGQFGFCLLCRHLLAARSGRILRATMADTETKWQWSWSGKYCRRSNFNLLTIITICCSEIDRFKIWTHSHLQPDKPELPKQFLVSFSFRIEVERRRARRVRERLDDTSSRLRRMEVDDDLIATFDGKWTNEPQIVNANCFAPKFS